MNTPLSAVSPADFEILMPGWTEEAYLAYLNSPSNRSADRVLTLANKLKDAVRRHLKRHQMTDVEVIAAADVPVPPRLAERGSNKAEFTRHHMRGFLYALTEFLITVEEFIPEPDDLGPAMLVADGEGGAA